MKVGLSGQSAPLSFQQQPAVNNDAQKKVNIQIDCDFEHAKLEQIQTCVSGKSPTAKTAMLLRWYHLW